MTKGFVVSLGSEWWSGSGLLSALRVPGCMAPRSFSPATRRSSVLDASGLSPFAVGSASGAGSSPGFSSADEEVKERERLEREEKLRRDEEKKNEYMERQKLLNLLEPPVVSLLERLGARDELSLPLAQHDVHSLKALRGCDHVELARALAAEDGIGDQEGETRGDKIRRKVQLLSRAVDMARRDIAIAAINALVLPDDVVFQKAALAKLHEEQGEALNAGKSFYQQKDKNQMREEDIPLLRDNDGALRKALLKVTEHWQDYLASQPAFATRLAADESAPTWKDTVAWALWMLTKPFASVHATWMSKDQIHQCLNHAREHVWFALYPQLRNQRPGEWRLYWVRVESNFAAFYSDKGRNRWMQAASYTARAEAVREGKSSDEQEAAAMQAAQKVMGILQQPLASAASTASWKQIPELPPDLQAPVRARSPQRQRKGPPPEARGRLRMQTSNQMQRRAKSARDSSPSGSARRDKAEKVSPLHLRMGLAVKGANSKTYR